MPMYEYHCESCATSFEKIVRTADRDGAMQCPACGSDKTARGLSTISVGGGEAAKSTSPPTGGCACGGPGPCGMG